MLLFYRQKQTETEERDRVKYRDSVRVQGEKLSWQRREFDRDGARFDQTRILRDLSNEERLMGNHDQKWGRSGGKLKERGRKIEVEEEKEEEEEEEEEEEKEKGTMDDGRKNGGIGERDAQRQYVVIGTLAPILLNFYLCYEVIGAAAPKGAMSCY